MNHRPFFWARARLADKMSRGRQPRSYISNANVNVINNNYCYYNLFILFVFILFTVFRL